MADQTASFQLPETLRAWGRESFADVAKNEIQQLKLDQLPLQQGIRNGSYALDTSLNVIIINTSEDDNSIRIKAGIFYTSIIAGCNCADDPAPVEEIPEYCDVMLTVNRDDAETTVVLLSE